MNNRDHGFSKVCPSGNTLIDAAPREDRDREEYPSWKEDEDMERYYEEKQRRKNE